MPQHDMVIANAVGATFRADINDALAALVANSSGATEPATKYAYMLWADTTAGVLKQRNAANTAWLTKAVLGEDFTFGTVTLTLTGCTTSPTIDFAYLKAGKVVTLSPKSQSISATSNSSAKTLTGLPSTLASATTYFDYGMSIDNGGAAVAASVQTNSSGVITLNPNTYSATWTASGTMTWYPKSYTWITA